MALEKLARKIKLEKFQAVKWIFYHGRNVDRQVVNWEWKGDKCSHFPSCDCDLELSFNPIYEFPAAKILRYMRSVQRETNEMLVEALAIIESRFVVENGVLCKRNGAVDTEYVKLMLHLGETENIKLIQPPVPRTALTQNSELRMPCPSVVKAVQDADISFFSKKLGRKLSEDDFQDVWEVSKVSNWKPPVIDEETGGPVKSLLSMCLRKVSGYNHVFGMIKGRLRVVSALAGLYESNKLARTIIKQQRPVAEMTPSLKEVLKRVPRALDFLYNAMGTRSQFRSICPKVTLDTIPGMYLGSASGLFPGPTMEAEIEGDKLKVNPCGKKLVTIEAILKNLTAFLSGRDGPMETYHNVSPKDEIFVLKEETLKDDQLYAAAIDKLRMFVIPNSFFILLERMTCFARSCLERGKVIQIGHKWSRGGADRLAKLFGVTRATAKNKVFGDGDVTNLDLNIHQVFLRIFYESGLVYYKKGSKEYDQLKELIGYVVQRVTQRITHLFGQLWAVLTGGMPSGCLMTSHGDSWIMALWFYLYCVMQMENAPPEIAEKIEKFMIDAVILMIVYGDDHVLCTPRDPDIVSRINILGFRDWLSKYLNVQLRDCHHDVPFETKAGDGPWATVKGVVFLRHRFVANPYASRPRQPEFLPYRESYEPLLKCVWGRANKDRDEVDVAMSTIGHAYGTYASNHWTYEWLHSLHLACIRVSGLKKGDCLQRAISRMGKEDIGKIKQMGVTAEEILQGFPSWETLIKKNEWDESYHDFSNYDPTSDFQTEWQEESWL